MGGAHHDNSCSTKGQPSSSLYNWYLQVKSLSQVDLIYFLWDESGVVKPLSLKRALASACESALFASDEAAVLQVQGWNPPALQVLFFGFCVLTSNGSNCRQQLCWALASTHVHCIANEIHSYAKCQFLRIKNPLLLVGWLKPYMNQEQSNANQPRTGPTRSARESFPFRQDEGQAGAPSMTKTLERPTDIANHCRYIVHMYNIYVYIHRVNICIHTWYIIEGSLEVKLPTIWRDAKSSQQGEESEEKRSEQRRCRCAKR